MHRCSDVTMFDSVSGSHAVWQVYMYCNGKIIVCRLQDADHQKYMDKFKSLGINKCLYKIPRTEWMDDSVASQNSIDNIDHRKLLANDVTVMLCIKFSPRKLKDQSASTAFVSVSPQIDKLMRICIRNWTYPQSVHHWRDKVTKMKQN